ncbi:hypothetical protein PR202_gb17552 [Eleusine coracana subsp. coracana]|uniref:Peptidase A1 domain-containing protein n=1 Tax=Eleusine coracana subsp. coracana TaxID=191504 RepID=A0AAV5F3T9_ELECO|nr:hypothetical protein PR202_gb17552 [Eleusine coracana subsp. coracana]
MTARSMARAASVRHRGGGNGNGGHPTAPVAAGTLGRPETEYLTHFAIGTPQRVALTLDTGAATSCGLSASPARLERFDQPSPVFDPFRFQNHPPRPTSPRA